MIATSSTVRGLPGLGRSSSPPMPSAAYRFFHTRSPSAWKPRSAARFRSCRSRPPPAARPGPLRQPGPDRRRPHPRGQHLTIGWRNLHLHSQRHEPSSAGHNQWSSYLAHGALGTSGGSWMRQTWPRSKPRPVRWIQSMRVHVSVHISALGFLVVSSWWRSSVLCLRSVEPGRGWRDQPVELLPQLVGQRLTGDVNQRIDVLGCRRSDDRGGHVLVPE